MAATGDEVASVAQAAEALDVDAQNSGATGDEAVRLRQLKMLRDSGAGGKKYKIVTDGSFPTQVQSSASAGDVVITAAGSGAVDYYVLELVEENPNSGKIISLQYETSSIDDLPQIVQDALANIPQTMSVPEPPRIGYSWFIMPPCDVFLQVQQ